MNTKQSPAVEMSVEYIEKGIQDGLFKPGCRLPNLSKLAKLAGVSRVTMVKAVALLKEKGTLSGVRGQYTSVSMTGEEMLHEAHEQDVEFEAEKRAKWRSIRALLEKDILNCVYSPGAILPSLKELQYTYHASFPTIKKTLEALEAEGIIVPHTHGYMVPILSPRQSNARIILMGTESGTGDINMGFAGVEYLRLFESECSRSGISVDILTWQEENNDIVFRNLFDKQTVNVEQMDSVLGFAYMHVHGGLPHTKVFRKLSHYKKPVAIFREGAVIDDPVFIASKPVFRVFASAYGQSPGIDVARYLLSLGHKKIAYVSAFHAGKWSKHRLEGIQNVYTDAHLHGGVVCGVSDKYTSQNDCRAEMFEMFNARELIQSCSSWRDTFAKKSSERSLRMIRHTIVHELQQDAVCLHMRPHMERLIKDRSITAWVCANDYIALMALDFLKEKNAAVPQRISLIGFDDSPPAISARMTSYNFNMQALTTSMIAHILNRKSIYHSRGRKIVEISGTISERHTTGKAPKTK